MNLGLKLDDVREETLNLPGVKQDVLPDAIVVVESGASSILFRQSGSVASESALPPERSAIHSP